VSSGVKNALHTLSCLFAKPFGRKMKEFTLVFLLFWHNFSNKGKGIRIQTRCCQRASANSVNVLESANNFGPGLLKNSEKGAQYRWGFVF